MNLRLKQRWIAGLAEYGLTLEEVKKNWSYAGGTNDSHYNYFNLVFPGCELPEWEDKCICKQTLKKENCFITDANKEGILIVGNCCIKMFMNNSGRTCELCGKSHRNSKFNRCNNCKKLPKYPYPKGTCWECNKKVRDAFTLCYHCHSKK